MKLSEILENIKITEIKANPDTEIAGISYDSRSTKPGDLFVAIKGFASDGHRFISKAVASGAAAVLCEDLPDSDVPYIRTDNSRLGLALTARNFYHDPASEMKMVGFTGTNGKTTSTYLLKHVLEETLGAKVGLIGTNGNMIGSEFLHSERTTPESLELNELLREMADAGCTHVVMEVSSHSLVLDRVAGIHYTTAAFTNLTQDHLDFHKTMEAYAEAKKILFSRCDTGIFNLDDSWCPVLMKDNPCHSMTFSILGPAALRAEDIELKASSVSFIAVYHGEKQRIRLAIPGRFSVYNALGVISAALSLGVTLEQCAAALATAKGVKGRAESVPVDGDYSVIIDYSHTPDSLENILVTMRPLTGNRLIVLFGCGGDRDRTKRPVMGDIANRLADVAIVTSDNPRTEEPMDIVNDILEGMEPKKAEQIVICDRIQAIHAALDMAQTGDVIVLAGKGHEDYQEINHVKHHMDEREIVADYLKARKGK